MRKKRINRASLGCTVASKEKFALSCVKATLICLAFTLVGVLIFAFILKSFSISDGAIKPINQVIKAVSIFFGCLIGLKKQKTMGLVKGFIIGLIYVLLAFFVFSALSGSFAVNLTLLSDVIFGGIMGAVCGVVAINFLKKPNN